MRHIQKDNRFRVNVNALAMAKSVNHRVPLSKRTRGADTSRSMPFVPPEDWYEPRAEESATFEVISQKPGRGHRHAVTPDEIRDRLSQLPEWMIRPLDVVQLSRMTRKKMTLPCYGMQWGSSLYLYPIEESLVEEFSQPPKPLVFNEARMFGGVWKQRSGSRWQLVWTDHSLRDFYLNNILIHELGHLLDDRNRSYIDRERFAEWFAVEYGYRPSRRRELARKAARRVIRRRHHSK